MAHYKENAMSASTRLVVTRISNAVVVEVLYPELATAAETALMQELGFGREHFVAYGRTIVGQVNLLQDPVYGFIRNVTSADLQEMVKTFLLRFREVGRIQFLYSETYLELITENVITFHIET